MNILIIPEDQTQDQYIVKPVIQAIAKKIGLPEKKVEVLPEPRLRGASDALDAELLAEILDDYPTTDLFLLVVDRDCNRPPQCNEDKAKQREHDHSNKLIACVAIQELEVWLLALYKDQITKAKKTTWDEIREECDPKERWAEPLLENLALGGPGGGRKLAMNALKGGAFKTLKILCPEVEDLQARIEQFAAQRSQA